jgi:ubiquinone/menaquinone biosynthesis C-methylase UbiE
MSIHANAAKGFARGAEDYEQGRPGCPRQAVDLLVAQFAIGPGTTVVDLGAGTGKFTRLLVPTGAHIVAVEPVAEMRAVFARAVPGVEVVDGTAEAIPCVDGSVDVVTAAQSFHWVDPIPAIDELYRVLHPGGGAAFIWNTRDATVGWLHAITELMDEIAEATPRYGAASGGRWQRAIEDHAGFSDVQHAQFRHDHATTRDATIARVASTSYVSALPDGERGKVLDRVDDIIRPLGDSFIEPYLTDVHWCRRRCGRACSTGASARAGATFLGGGRATRGRCSSAS